MVDFRPMGPNGSGKSLVKIWGERLPAGKRGVLVYLLVLVAGGWVVGRALHKRLASQELLAYETSLAASGPTRMAATRPVFSEMSFPARTTFGEFLSSQGIDSQTSDVLVKDVRPVYDLGRVRAGNNIRIARTPRGDLFALSYQIDPDRVLQITRDKFDFQARIEQVPYQIASVGISGQVQNSLIRAVEDLGERDELALRIADIFGWDLDFNTETQQGDTFAVKVEKRTLNGKFQSYGRILAAEYRNGSRTFQAVMYHDPEGRPA